MGWLIKSAIVNVILLAAAAHSQQADIPKFREWQKPGVKTNTVYVLLARFGGPKASVPGKQEDFKKLCGDDYPGLSHYFRSISYGGLRLKFKVSDWIDIPGQMSDYHGDSKLVSGEKLLNAASYITSIPPVTNYIVLCNANDGTTYPYSGALPNGKGFSIIPWPNGIRQQVFCHEFGHQVGFDHSSGQIGQTYDSPWDVMSTEGTWGKASNWYGAVGGETNAYHKLVAGWIPRSQVANVSRGEARKIRIERLAEPVSSADPLVVVVRPSADSSIFWTIEARMSAGYDTNAIPTEGVIVHECDTQTRDGRASKVVDISAKPAYKNSGTAFVVGMEYVSKRGLSFKVLSKDDSGFTINLKYR